MFDFSKINDFLVSLRASERNLDGELISTMTNEEKVELDKISQETYIDYKAYLEAKKLSYGELIDLLVKITLKYEAASSVYTKIDSNNNEIFKLQEGQHKNYLKRGLYEGFLGGVKSQKSNHAKEGGKAKSAKNDPLRELAIKLVTEKTPPYPSRHNASVEIKAEIILAGKALRPQVVLSEDGAQVTINGWLKVAGLLPPKPKTKKYPVS